MVSGNWYIIYNSSPNTSTHLSSHPLIHVPTHPSSVRPPTHLFRQGQKAILWKTKEKKKVCFRCRNNFAAKRVYIWHSQGIYSIISSQIHVKYSQCFLVAGIKNSSLFPGKKKRKGNLGKQAQTEESYLELKKGKVLFSPVTMELALQIFFKSKWIPLVPHLLDPTPCPFKLETRLLVL